MDLLPVDLGRARREAKELLARARLGDPVARGRLRSDRSPRLADAQHAVARSHGFLRWVDLVRAYEDAASRLRRAAIGGDDDAVYELLDAGASPNARDRRTGRTALLAAAAADQLDSVSALVGWVPVDRFARDGRGRTALDLARPGSPVAAVLTSCGLGPARPHLGARYAEQSESVTVELLAHLARAPGVEQSALGDGFVLRSGLEDNTRNAVVCSRIPDGVAVEDVVARLTDVPACWHVGEDTDPPDLRQRLHDAGCAADGAAVHMAAELDRLDGALSSDVTEVTDPADLVHLEPGEARLVAAAGPPLRHFTVGRSAGMTTFSSNGTILGVHLRVERARRRHGLGATLVRHAIAVAREDGCRIGVLSPTPATVPFYERFGFTLERSQPDRTYYLPMSTRPEL